MDTSHVEKKAASGALIARAAASSAAAALQRQPDGSFTLWRYLGNAPYSFVDSTPDYQSVRCWWTMRAMPEVRSRGWCCPVREA